MVLKIKNNRMKNYLSIIGIFLLASVMNVNAAQVIIIKAPDVIPIFKDEPELSRDGRSC